MLAAAIRDELVALADVFAQRHVFGGLPFERFEFLGGGKCIFLDGLEQFRAGFVGEEQLVLRQRLVEELGSLQIVGVLPRLAGRMGGNDGTGLRGRRRNGAGGRRRGFAKEADFIDQFAAAGGVVRQRHGGGSLRKERLENLRGLEGSLFGLHEQGRLRTVAQILALPVEGLVEQADALQKLRMVPGGRREEIQDGFHGGGDGGKCRCRCRRGRGGRCGGFRKDGFHCGGDGGFLFRQPIRKPEFLEMPEHDSQRGGDQQADQAERDLFLAGARNPHGIGFGASQADLFLRFGCRFFHARQDAKNIQKKHWFCKARVEEMVFRFWGRKDMKVCLDIQASLGQRAGVGRYVRELLAHLGAEAGDDELSAFYFDFKRTGLDSPPAGVKLRACRWMPGRVAQGAWKKIGFPPFDWFAGRADLYHFPNFIRPPLSRGRKSVVTIHDVSFLRMPETTEARNLAWLTSEIRQTAERADAILTDSHFSAREICELLPVSPDKVFPVWLGLTPFGPPASAEVVAQMRQSLGLEKPYLLMVGPIEPRKNIPFLVKVYEALKDFDGDLVLAGGLGWKTGPTLRAISESPRKSGIRILKHMNDAQLAGLYAGASAFVFPTRYEGFGFPPLEAMGRGTPVVSAHNSSLPEVLGDAAHWVKGYDAEEWAQAIRAVLGDSSHAARLRAAGLEQARKFTWAETARKTWAVYRRLM